MLTLAQAADPVVDSHWTYNPQLPFWALTAGFVIAAIAAFYLYRAQSRIASKKAVVALTVIRTLLILLVFVMLLGLARVFSHTGKANGSLWLMVDQSQSMDRADSYADPVEKLRWADSLGLFPKELRPGTPDRIAARLSMLNGDLVFFQGLAGQPVEEKDAKGKLNELSRGLRKWNSQLIAIADSTEKDPVAGADPATANIVKSLRSAAESAGKGIETLEGRSKPEEAVGDLPWNDLRLALGSAADKLNRQADVADRKIISQADQRVTDSLDKVGKLTRAQLAVAVMTRKSSREAGGFNELLPKQKLKILGFGETPQIMIPDGEKSKQAVEAALAKPSAIMTDMAGGFQSIRDQVGQGEPASVILVSDGRQNKRDADVAGAIDRLSGRGVRVFSLAMGTERLAPDAAVENIDAPDWVFKGDSIQIKSLLRLDNLKGKSIKVELHRKRQVNGQIEDTLVDSRDRKVPDSGRDVISFAEKGDEALPPGLYDYQVLIKDVPDEVVTANNTQTVRVWVKDEKLSVLMIEDQPRWEWRYVSNYLSREPQKSKVRLQTLLLQPARIGYDPDPSKNIAPPPPRKPTTDEKDERQDFQILPGADKTPAFKTVAGKQVEDDAEGEKEWYPWNVIMIGDVSPEKIPVQAQKRIVKAVRDNGATLILMSGPLAMPGAWGTSGKEYPLAELFPVDPSPDWTPLALGTHLKVGYHPSIAPDGEGHMLSQFGIDDVENRQIWKTITTDPNLGWYWHSEYTQAKGGASVIWSIGDAELDAAKPSTAPADNKSATVMETARKRALLATMNAGLGKVLYFAGDASWRLRQVNGINYHEKLWGQVIRWAVENNLPAGGKFVKFGADKPRYVGGEQALINARIVNKDLVPQQGLKVKVRARVLDASGKVDPGAKSVVETEMTETPGAPGRYQAVFGELPAGQVELSLVGKEVEELLEQDPTAQLKTLGVEVSKTMNLETRNVNSDFQKLRSLSSAANGVMLNGCYADLLAEHIPELNYTTTSAEQIGLFTDPKEQYAAISHWVFLIAFATLATAEWLIRKASGLV